MFALSLPVVCPSKRVLDHAIGGESGPQSSLPVMNVPLKRQTDVPASMKSAIAPRRTSLRRFSSSAHRLTRLVAFPWCGAGASVYRRLAPHLPDTIDFVAVQLPGREDRYGERPLLRMAEVVDSVIGDVMTLLDRPEVLFGHSMGALIAYEVALAVRERIGCEPASLIVSGHGAPHCSEPSTRCWHAADEPAFIANIRALGGTPHALLDDP